MTEIAEESRWVLNNALTSKRDFTADSDRSRRASTNNVQNIHNISPDMTCDTLQNTNIFELLSQNENQSDNIMETNEMGSLGNETLQNTEKKRKRKNNNIGDVKIKRQKGINKRKDRAIKRNSGHGYCNNNGKQVSPKKVRENPCKNCINNCHEISEEQRQQIFNYYYNLPSQRKREWLLANTQAVDIKRRRSKENVSKRKVNYNYYINVDGVRRQVCLQFMHQTLDLNQKFIHCTISNAYSNTSKPDMRRRKPPANKTPEFIKQGVLDYIRNLPTATSHYCQKDSPRLYLPEEFKSISHIYQLYKESDYSSKGKHCVSHSVFRNIFRKEFNIAFHIHKTDDCSKCISFADKPINDAEEQTNDVEEQKNAQEAEHSEIFKPHQNDTIHCEEIPAEQGNFEMVETAEESTFTNNSTDNIQEDNISLDMSCDTDQDVLILEVLPQNDVHMENNLGTNETDSKSRISNKKDTGSDMDSLISEDEAFECDSDDEPSSSDEALQNTGRKQKNSILENDGLKKQKRINKRKDIATKRNRGLGYVRKDGKKVRPKEMKENPCKNCLNRCHEISEEQRQQIFDHYYKLSSQSKRDWLIANTRAVDIKRRRSKDSRRTVTYNYYINVEGVQRQVCLQFMHHTLDLTQKFIHNTISNARSNIPKPDMRGRQPPANRTPEFIKQGVLDYIKNLPTATSHYCQKDSPRLYLPQEFKSISHLYQFYKTDYTSKGKRYVSEKIFRDIFTKEFDITFHIPKKNKCKICVLFANNPTNYTEKQRKAHLKEAEDSKERFKSHKNITKQDNETLCVSFDLQEVLNTPYGESMSIYYTRKYSVYNLTFYESFTKEGYCNSWGECDGKRDANEMATILLKYIQMVDDRQTIKNLLLYSNSCSGQNKKKVIFAAIHASLQACQHIETIQMNFHLPGHASTPVDKVHAQIEESVKKIIIHAPSQWYTVFTLARKNPKPLNTEILRYYDFISWDSLVKKYFKNNVAGKIGEVRVMTVQKSDPNHIYIKRSMGKNAETERLLVLGKNRIPSKRLYDKPLPISDAKYNDLVTLCNLFVIPRQFHDEFKNLPHGNVKDTLPDTDVEDSD